MSDLQLALIALGAVIIAGVVVFNWWQERRLAQESIRRFDGPVDDALLRDFHIEAGDEAARAQPSFEVKEIFDDISLPEDDVRPNSGNEPEQPDRAFEPEPIAAGFQEEAAAAEPVAPAEEAAAVSQATEPEPQEIQAETTEAPQVPGLNERIDLIAVLQAEAGFAPAAVAQAMQGMPKFDKRVTCLGRNETGEWQALGAMPATHFTQLACALQLADCAGPVSRETLDGFEAEMEKQSAALGASLEWQGAADPLGYAAELDQFCVEVDVMVGFHIMHGENGQIAGTKLRGLAEAQGLQLHEDGLFHFEDASGTTMFTLGSQDQRPFRPETLRTGFYRGISFQLDVPRCGRCTDAYNQMVLLARQLETALEGNLVDDNQRHLGDAEIGKIALQLEAIHARMLQRGIVPGSPTALRLFS